MSREDDSVLPDEPAAPLPASGQARLNGYWQHNRRLTGVLLLLWAAVSFLPVYFARQLTFDFFGWPFSFWVASQGAILVFFAIVAFYAWRMRQLDEAFHAETPPPAHAD